MSSVHEILQRLFDIQIDKMQKQGKPCFDPLNLEFWYRYTNDDGEELCCGIGHLISDEEYENSYLEYKNATNSVVFNAIMKSQQVPVYVYSGNKTLIKSFLNDCQAAHDSTGVIFNSKPDKMFMESYLKRMKDVALKYNLDFDPNKNSHTQI